MNTTSSVGRQTLSRVFPIASLPAAGVALIVTTFYAVGSLQGTATPTIKGGTTAMVVALALSLFLSPPEAARPLRILSIICAAAAGVIGLYYLWPSPDSDGASTFWTAPSPVVCMDFVLLAASVILLQLRKVPHATIALIVIVAFLPPLHCFISLATEGAAFTTTGPLADMSFQVSLVLMLLAMAAMLHPRLPFGEQLVADNIQGHFLRTVLPWTFLAPVAITLLFNIGLTHHLYDSRFVTVAVASTLSITISAALWSLSLRLQRTDDRHVLTERSLAESESRANQIFEFAPNAMLVVNSAGKIVRCNARMEKLFGYPRTAMIGQPMSMLIPERYRAGHGGNMKAYFSSPKARYMGEGRDLYALREDGTEVAVEIGLAPIETTHGLQVLANIVDITARLRAKSQIEVALQEKTVLLNEVHHRVKNNLQIVASMLNLQSIQVDNPYFSELITESEGRVRAMALMHQVLYERKNFARVDLNVYLERLVALITSIHEAPETGITTRLNTTTVTLDLTRAIPLGLIVHELLTNSFKHAFKDKADGEVALELYRDGESEAVLVVADNGCGLPTGQSFVEAKSLGMEIVEVLAEQIHATLAIEKGPGARFELRFNPQTEVLGENPEDIGNPTQAASAAKEKVA